MKRLAVFIGASLLLACSDQDPYNGKEVSGAPPPPPPAEKPTRFAYSLSVPDVMEFWEGKENEYKIRGAVPPPGKPVIVFKGLPKGAVYNAADETLVWTPGYQDGNDPRDPGVLYRKYILEVGVRSSEEGSVETTKQVMLVVADTARPAQVKSQLEQRVNEGQTLNHVIVFEDQEYPSGPFDASFVGLPPDVTVDWPDHKQPRFILRWKPGYDQAVNKATRDLTAQISIFNPRGKRLTFNILWTVQNDYIVPQTVGPTSVVQKGNVNFALMAYDPNYEDVPKWEVAVQPPYGLFSISSQPINSTDRKPASAGLVSWQAIPPDKLGMTYTIQLRACVQRVYCTLHKVDVVPLAFIENKGENK